MPDNTRFWWEKMSDPKDFLIIPNAEHSEATGILELLPAITTFSRGIQVGKDLDVRPRFNWTISEDGTSITVRQVSKHTPIAVHMWHAVTCGTKRRDFRVLSIEGKEECHACGNLWLKNETEAGVPVCANIKSFWSRKILQRNPTTGDWVAEMQPRSDGRWTAFFVHMEYKGLPPNYEYVPPQSPRDWPVSVDGHYQMTTTVSIIPQTYPFPDCVGNECLGTLI